MPYLAYEKADVLQLNAEFFDAISKGDIDRLRAIWLPSDNAICIHVYYRNILNDNHIH